MVSRQEGTLFSRKRDFTAYGEEFHNSFKKNKQEDKPHGKLQSTMCNERSNLESMRSELHLHTPQLPSDWQKSIDAKGYSRTSVDRITYPKDHQVLVGQPKMSLDLELNLSPCYSPTNTTKKIDESSNHNETVLSSKGKNLTSPSKKTSLSWLMFEGCDDGVDQTVQEMVTKVCMKCHMLVMLCTSTPVCPNCKFMHPHDHCSTKLFKSPNLLRLLC